MQQLLTSKGYTLVDAIFQLTILLLFSHLLLMYFLWFSQIERHFFQTEAVDWEMFSLDFESYISFVTAIEGQFNNTGIRFVKNGEEYDIECYPSLIRKQKNRLGHEPMLTGVKLCKIQLVEEKVLIQVEFLSGRKESRTFEVFIPSQ